MFWPRKPKPLEQFVPPPLGHWEIVCSSCLWFFPASLEEALQIGEMCCPACEYVNGLAASAQDFILNVLEYDLERE